MYTGANLTEAKATALTVLNEVSYVIGLWVTASSHVTS